MKKELVFFTKPLFKNVLIGHKPNKKYVTSSK